MSSSFSVAVMEVRGLVVQYVAAGGVRYLHFIAVQLRWAGNTCAYKDSITGVKRLACTRRIERKNCFSHIWRCLIFSLAGEKKGSAYGH